MGLFGVISLILAHTPLAKLAGLVYFFICIPKTIVPWTMGIKRTKREVEMLAT
jgi:hypothetical protein